MGGSGYVQCAMEAFKPILNGNVRNPLSATRLLCDARVRPYQPALVDTIVNSGLTLCGEGIYPDDPCHGT
eukprot:786891-Rhodomonas_salina.1